MKISEAVKIVQTKLENIPKEQVMQLACLDKLRRKRKLNQVSSMVYSVEDQEKAEVNSKYFRMELLNINSIDIAKSKSRLFVKEVKKLVGCRLCKETHFSCLDFHHLDKSEKTFRIAVASNSGYPIKRIADEMQKCSLLCSNCHRKEHHPF